MKMKLIKRQILDEREEQLVNKAGMESFSLMLCGSLALYMGSVAMNGGVVHYQSFLLLILISSFYFMCRAQYLGANYYNSFLESLSKRQKNRFDKYLEELEKEG
ncbi:DUF6773 family protein [Streptococcus sp. Marseille-Q8145]